MQANVEELVLTGDLAINATGNTLDNYLKGNGAANTLTGGNGNDTLDGGAGADVLIGGAGDDIYVIDNAADVVVESSSAGTDTVRSTLTTTLGNHVENLVLMGTEEINGTGNALDNVMTGNAANNTLDGGSGADRMSGGWGDDTYFVNQTGDVVTELTGQGNDTVCVSISYTLGAHLENLVLLGSANLNATGNAQDNVLTGNAGSNVLSGGTGNDTYVVGLGHGSDLVRENDATAGNTDVASFLSGIGADQIWLRQVGNNLEASVIGTSDKLTIEDWYSGSAYRIEQFKTADGKTLLDSQVDNLVQAMSAFAPPSAGQTTLPQTYQDALGTVIAANWQ